ncbi:hypothetical protein GHT06_007004 [Daphnia sinensis]|uniref:Uncharacterized protein n=1 Tax=Daphnia sinensis TaxID=1820382 RepID=A0AAD5L2S2_9CRUS|nr:hypothetical protein GHT06_007004 [Daphnia sinensis]
MKHRLMLMALSQNLFIMFKRKTVQNKAVNHNTVQDKAVKLAGKRKNTNKVLKKNPIEPNVTSLTMNEDFPGKKKACSSEIAVHACPKSDNKENEGLMIHIFKIRLPWYGTELFCDKRCFDGRGTDSKEQSIV